MPHSDAKKTIECFGGDGPPVVLVHGFGADRYSWLGTAPDLVKQTTVYTVELPGHGNAWDIPAPDGLQQLSDQILSPALAKISSDSGLPVHLVGHSLGGALAMLATAHDTTHNTSHIASLSLLAPLGLGSGANVDFIEKYVELDNEAAALELLQQTVFNERLISSQLIKPLLMHLGQQGVRTTLRSLARDVLNPGDELASAVEQVSASVIPRQVIWGLNDNINAFVAADESRFGGRWHTMENCGHLPHVEQRVQVNQLLLDLVQPVTGV